MTLPALGVAPPVTRWGAEEAAIDLLHHSVYALVTGYAYEALDGKDRALSPDPSQRTGYGNPSLPPG